MKKIILGAIILFTLTALFGAYALAETAVEEVAAGGTDLLKIALGLGAAFTIAVAAVGGAFAMSKAATSALEGIARNPEAAGKIMTPMIIALALIESLVVYALVIAFLLQAKIG